MTEQTRAAVRDGSVCETCDGDGYVDIVDDWGGVIGPAPCPNCSPDDPLEAVDALVDVGEAVVIAYPAVGENQT